MLKILIKLYWLYFYCNQVAFFAMLAIAVNVLQWYISAVVFLFRQMIKFFSRVLTEKESCELSVVVADMIIYSQLLVPMTLLLVVLDLVMQS